MILLFFLNFPMISYGEDVPISVKPIFPENQINENDSFYNLRVSPNQKQTIGLEVINNGEKPVTIHTEVVPAATAMTGNIIYVPENLEKIDESNKYPLSKIVQTNEDVTIPAKGKTQVDIFLTMPDEKVAGIILGGVRISLVSGESTEEKKSEEGFSIKNEYSYVIAIQLSESDEAVAPDMKLLKVYPSQIAGRNTLKINLQNPMNLLVDEIDYEAKVYQKGSDEVLHQASYTNYRMAPTNNFDLPVSWENKPFQSGTYLLKLKATSKQPEGSWGFEQEFTISDKEAKELNEKAVELDKDYTMYIIIGALVAILLIILLILFLVLRKRKKKKQRRKKKNAGKGKGRRPTKSTNTTNAKRPANKRGSASGRPTKNSKKRK